MAESIDTSSFDNFSIQNTMEMGMGNTELLNDLFAPESATTNPDDIKDIKEEAPPKKEITPTEEKVDKKEESPKKEDASKSITDFLMGEDGEDEVKKETLLETEKERSTDPEKEEEQEQEGTQFSALSNDLFKLGVFTKEDGEEDVNISTPEEFLERFQAEKKKGAIEVVNNFIGQFGEDYQQAFEAIFVKGVDPKEYFNTYNNIQSFSEMDLTDESNQVSVLRQALTDQGYDKEDIDTEVERLKNYGDLESVAQKHHKVLIKKEAQKLAQMEQENEKRLSQQQAIKQQYLQNVNNILQEKVKTKEFDGIPINPKLAGELQDFLLTDKYKTSSGETLTEFDRTILDLKRPENHEKKVKVGLLLKLLEKDPTLSTIQKTGLTKKSNELFGEVARQTTKNSVKSKTPTNPTSWFV